MRRKCNASDLIAKVKRAQALNDSISIKISFEADGTASVSFDDSVPFRVPPVLAYLLQLLAMDTSCMDWIDSDDPLVPFKSYGEIAAAMTKILGDRKFTRGALRQGIHRLRKTLACHGFDGLLQTNRLRGAYRIAVRRKKNPTLASSI
jgi:hypothetical protein